MKRSSARPKQSRLKRLTIAFPGRGSRSSTLRSRLPKLKQRPKSR